VLAYIHSKVIFSLRKATNIYLESTVCETAGHNSFVDLLNKKVNTSYVGRDSKW
jgi:hypothetical protein